MNIIFVIILHINLHSYGKAITRSGFLILFKTFLPALAQQPKLKWTKLYKTTINIIDGAVAITVDAASNSYVIGNSHLIMTNNMVTVKYAPSGEQLWEMLYPKSRASDIAIDNADNVYVTGTSSGTAGVSFVTVRYDAATGEGSCGQYYSGGGPSFAKAIAVDNTGGVHVTGSVFNNRLSFSDYATVRDEAATGEETRARLYNGSENENDFATDIAADKAGGVYVTGSSGTNFSSDCANLRYEATTSEET